MAWNYIYISQKRYKLKEDTSFLERDEQCEQFWASIIFIPEGGQLYFGNDEED